MLKSPAAFRGTMSFHLAEGDAIVRYLHIMAGIFWMGLLWFFNLINGKVMKEIPAEVKKEVFPRLMGPAMWWFRWMAMWTLIFGLILFGFKIEVQGFMEINAAIYLGMILAIYMWFNVWFMIWPRQKLIIANLGEGGPKPPDDAAPKAAFYSRINAWLSIPVIFLMVLSAHRGGSFPSLGSLLGM